MATKNNDKLEPKQPPGKVFDVSRPGKSLASPTSRPIIVGHKPEVQDSVTQMSGIGGRPILKSKQKIEVVPAGEEPSGEPVASPAAAQEAAHAELSPQTDRSSEALAKDEEALANVALDKTTDFPHQQKTLEPPAAPVEEAPAAPSPESEPEPQPQAEPEPQPEPASEQPAEAEESEEPIVTVEPEDKEPPADLVPGAEPDQAGPDVATAAEEDHPAEAETPHIEPLFDSSGVVVSSHHHKSSGWKVVLLLLFILVLAAAILDILLDANLVNLEGIPHTNFLTDY